MRLVLATANPGKLGELRSLLEPLGIEGVAQAELGVAAIAETGKTFVENAILKARHAARCTRSAALADDSGLEVDALGGQPGVHSARFAGQRASDAQNNDRLLEELQGIAPMHRTARYRCVLALVRSPDDPSPVLCEGTWEGRIAEAPAGTLGFGYDPLFLVEGTEGTAGQLDPQVKNLHSHRGKALARLVEALRAGH